MCASSGRSATRSEFFRATCDSDFVSSLLGKLRSRQPQLSKKQQTELARMHDAGDHNITDLAEVLSISQPTVYRTINRVRAAQA